ncbi:MAG: DUF2809 domain-containing protein [Planctomycetota bacterium]
MQFSRSLRPAIACAVSVVACLAYAATRNSLPDWLRGHAGGVPYVLFWILLWLTVIPRRTAIPWISVGCVLFTCWLEVFQLYQGPQWLIDFRRTTLGAAWLGAGFDPWDIPPYFLGGVLGWWIGTLVVPTTPEP